MGVLTEFFIATPTDLQRFHDRVQPIDIFTATDFKGVSFEELTDLRMLITQTPKVTDDDLERESILVFNHTLSMGCELGDADPPIPAVRDAPGQSVIKAAPMWLRPVRSLMTSRTVTA